MVAQTYSKNILPAPCRGCGGPSWLSDDLGAVHPCCELNGQPCVGCKASEMSNREWRRRHGRRQDQSVV